MKIPSLVVYSPEDKTVDVSAVIAAFQGFGAEQKKLLAWSQVGDPDRHVLAGDILSPSSTVPLADSIVEFLRGLPADL
jgi:hypothetical protein